ncbi:uncharacterized protein THITE_2107689 [Thermothielavioides terrestris NRRL 8126]|uniref:Uncharacterized protein n=1 Tax=Thermothielavioides terrestris (strain ATCC 38088 / NRRL 8126) TaxID=578455 RepID=G2QUQ4_THETT|nr:uncharacterized protein THITE_2107689 [Thermothielavioides terrestris NRRL 8126]AEO62899.1 hypothetical protein THITE_2107689 [Thermothielavioides terrestris NRRL 8126]
MRQIRRQAHPHRLSSAMSIRYYAVARDDESGAVARSVVTLPQHGSLEDAVSPGLGASRLGLYSSFVGNDQLTGAKSRETLPDSSPKTDRHISTASYPLARDSPRPRCPDGFPDSRATAHPRFASIVRKQIAAVAHRCLRNADIARYSGPDAVREIETSLRRAS